MATMAGGLIQSCAPMRDERRWSAHVATRCTPESPGRCARARLEGHPSRQDGRRLTWGSRESPMCAREMGREGVQDTRETRAVCINATAGGAESCAVGDRHGQRGGKVVTLVDVRRAYFYAPARRQVFVELPPEDCQPGDEHMHLRSAA